MDQVHDLLWTGSKILCGPQSIKGFEAIRAFFSGVSASFDGFELDVSVGESDHQYIAWHTGDGSRGTDTFYIRDRKIVLQTAFFIEGHGGPEAETVTPS